MIIHEKFIIATPTKCGTLSIEHALEQQGCKLFWPRHDPEPPAGFTGEVIMMRRNPIARFESMWNYYKRQPFWKRNDRYTDLNDWCYHFFNLAGLDHWTMTLSMFEQRSQATRTFDMTEIPQLFEYLRVYGINVEKIPYRNKTLHPDPFQLTDEYRALRDEWARPDMERFEYAWPG